VPDNISGIVRESDLWTKPDWTEAVGSWKQNLERRYLLRTKQTCMSFANLFVYLQLFLYPWILNLQQTTHCSPPRFQLNRSSHLGQFTNHRSNSTVFRHLQTTPEDSSVLQQHSHRLTATIRAYRSNLFWVMACCKCWLFTYLLTYLFTYRKCILCVCKILHALICCHCIFMAPTGENVLNVYIRYDIFLFTRCYN